MLAQHLHTEARLVLLERLFNWRSAWKIHVQVEMLEIAKFVTIVFSLVSLVPVDQLWQDLWNKLEDQGKGM